MADAARQRIQSVNEHDVVLTRELAMLKSVVKQEYIRPELPFHSPLPARRSAPTPTWASPGSNVIWASSPVCWRIALPPRGTMTG